MSDVLAPPVRRESLETRLPRMARAFAVLFLEIEAGHRQRRHLRKLMTPLLYARLTEVWVRPAASTPTVLKVRGRRSAAGLYDVVATVDRGHRITALAFSLRRTPAGWRVDDLIRPEHGPLPEPPFPVPVDEPDIFDLLGV